MTALGVYLLVVLFCVFWIGLYGILKADELITDSAAYMVWMMASSLVWFFAAFYLVFHICQFFFTKHGWCWDVNARW